MEWSSRTRGRRPVKAVIAVPILDVATEFVQICF
jgi:hypothetical protein